MKDQSKRSLGDAACSVLLTPEAREKAEAARRMAVAWRSGGLDWIFPATPPGRPARPGRPLLLLPRDMPRRRGGGTTANRIALLHAVAHIELNAIDLACDMVARFGGGDDLPRAFCDDWVRIIDDEARHFLMLSDRLQSLGGLWRSARP